MGEAVKLTKGRPNLVPFADANGNWFQPVLVRAERDDGTLGPTLTFAGHVLDVWSEMGSVDRRFLRRSRAVSVPMHLWQRIAPIARARCTPADAAAAGVAEVDE